MRWTAAVTFVAVIAGCSGEESGGAGPRCTLPGCESRLELGSVDALVGFAGDGIVFATYANAPMWDLWFYSLRDGRAVQIAAEIPLGAVRLDHQGGVLFIADTWYWGGYEEWDHLRGQLHRWDSHTGLDRVLLDEVRPGQYDACGDWVWAWHGQATHYVNCGFTSVIDLRDDRATPIAISCDVSGPQRAFFAEACRIVASGGPDDASLSNLVIHEPGAQASFSIRGWETGWFTLNDDGTMVAIGSKVTEIASPHEQSLPERGEVLAIASGGGEVAYVPEGDEVLRIWQPGAAASELLSNSIGGARFASYSPDARLLAWVEDPADGPSSLHVLDRETGAAEVIASNINFFYEDAERFWRPSPRALAFAGEGRWLVFGVGGASQGVELVAWDRESRASHVLSRSPEIEGALVGVKPRAIAVDRHVAWIESGALFVADLARTGKPTLVAEGVRQFVAGPDRIAWTNLEGEGAAEVFAP